MPACISFLIGNRELAIGNQFPYYSPLFDFALQDLLGERHVVLVLVADRVRLRQAAYRDRKVAR